MLGIFLYSYLYLKLAKMSYKHKKDKVTTTKKDSQAI
jgi:hypothetical protein